MLNLCFEPEPTTAPAHVRRKKAPRHRLPLADMARIREQIKASFPQSLLGKHANERPAISEKATFNLVQITDVHVNPHYKEVRI